MKIITCLPEREGWHLREGMPIQVGIKSGSTPFSGPHLHRTMAEYFYLLAGEISLRVDRQEIIVRKGDLVVVEPGEAHEVLSASPDARLLLLMPPFVAGDKEELEEPERQKGKVKRQK
ncbi:MAG: cupin domain-containing protein [Acidobacteria bacterium]|jgi:quercetin dioxygenase-like cupin family protein|nr:cupin domain-containing protein [Acidobacteriota bacterium]